MNALAHSRSTTSKSISDVWKPLFSWWDRGTSPVEPQEDARASRDFLLEVLDKSPDAFQSDLDVLTMAHMCHCRF